MPTVSEKSLYLRGFDGVIVTSKINGPGLRGQNVHLKSPEGHGLFPLE